MKALSFKIPKTSTSSIHVQVDCQRYFYGTLHQHPETQITLIVSGTGTLFQGDYIGDFKSGDVYVIGANVPHVLKSDMHDSGQPESMSHAISIFFDESSLGTSFFKLPELAGVQRLLHESARGIALQAETRAIVGQQIAGIVNTSGVVSIISLLEILHEITESNERSFLSPTLTPYAINENEGLRLNEIFQFTVQEYHRNIRLDEVAAMANLTVSAFCRYFKRRTRKTYITFLNEVRIAQACKLLLDEDLTVVQVCYQCGFCNLSHFNRVFKAIQKVSPKSYRKSRSPFV